MYQPSTLKENSIEISTTADHNSDENSGSEHSFDKQYRSK